MSPRPYRRERRDAAAEQTRGRIVEAARALLAAPDGMADFSMEAVARQADVARMTVYYQFGSRRGLLEALFDDLAARGRIGELLSAAFQQPDPLKGLDALILAFVEFWAVDRLVMRRLRSLAALDLDVAQGVRERDERRRQAALALLDRLAARHGWPAEQELHEATDLLFTLTSFESFDSLAGETRSASDIARLLQRTIRAALGLETRSSAEATAEALETS
jgi:AcrR family transcriptional regulator